MNLGAEWASLVKPVPSCPEPFHSYQDSLAEESKIYENCRDVHNLPPIFHYWSNRHILPKLESFGFNGPVGMFEKHLSAVGSRPGRFLSLGAGNCDLEIDLARGMKGAFRIDCVDLNTSMLERGRQSADRARLSAHLSFIRADLNTWKGDTEYDAIIANQSLHHVVNLEGLFDEVKRSLRPGGEFLISDMIGRNGHQRWPEALDVVQEYWRELPPSYRSNQLLGDYEELYQSWDCSVQGFEGVRSQDILPLLLKQFHFHVFIAYGNVIDPFVDRAFGGHFNPSLEWDRSFIDKVHERDEKELASGRLKPTHMIAVVKKERCSRPRFLKNQSPEFCVRAPENNTTSLSKRAPSPYQWDSWPHDRQRELEIVCRQLAETGHEIKKRTAWALTLSNQLEERTAWALSLERDVQASAAYAKSIERELVSRSDWALSLQSELDNRTSWALDLKQQVEALEIAVEERTAWALRVKEDLANQTARATEAERELYELMHNPIHLVARILKSLRNRLFRKNESM
jgi:ubiquinone/menaquinone biosynthesis C-methylase UbiE